MDGSGTVGLRLAGPTSASSAAARLILRVTWRLPAGVLRKRPLREWLHYVVFDAVNGYQRHDTLFPTVHVDPERPDSPDTSIARGDDQLVSGVLDADLRAVWRPPPRTAHYTITVSLPGYDSNEIEISIVP